MTTKTKKSPKFEIQKTLVVSTGHITQDDSKILAEAANDGLTLGTLLITYDSEYWHILYLTTLTQSSARMAGLSTACRKWIKIAKDLGCDWIKFDRDGEVYEDYPTFDW